MGHTNIQITLNTYTSVFNKYKESEITKVNDYYLNNNIISYAQKEICDYSVVCMKNEEWYFMSRNKGASLFYRKERNTWIVQYYINDYDDKRTKKSFKEKADAVF